MAEDSVWDPRSIEAPRFNAERLLLVGSGSVSAAFLPFWVNWLQRAYRDLAVQVVLTRSAQRFVTREALAGLSRRTVLSDEWPDETGPGAMHIQLAKWPDAIAVYPATMHFLGRLAQGLADTPTLLALQCTRAPIALAAALPPGCWDNPAMARHRKILAEHDNIAVLPPVSGLSMATGEHNGHPPGSLAKLLGLLEALRASQPDGSASGDGRMRPVS